jgi:hypothetical protein
MDRHCCATCVHIESVRRGGVSFYRCGRLGWNTRPAWKFACWVERSPAVKMRRVVEPGG